MLVITADQVDSRHRLDVVDETQRTIQERFGERLALDVDRNAGDEVQAVTADADAALGIVLTLQRTDDWSIGIGCGGVREPLPRAARAASGPAFFAAREAVESAKKRVSRLALRSGAERERTMASDIEAILELLITVRARRSEAGWELYDLLQDGMTQRDAAMRLGISEPAVSSRARAAGIHPEASAVPAIGRLMADLDRRSSEGDS